MMSEMSTSSMSYAWYHDPYSLHPLRHSDPAYPHRSQYKYLKYNLWHHWSRHTVQLHYSLLGRSEMEEDVPNV